MDDRVIRWLCPEPGRYLEWFPRLIEMIGAPAFVRSTAALDSDGIEPEKMAEQRPRTPTWYLPFIGVDRRRQGEGLGSGLLARGTARAGAAGLPGYVEASSARNRALYERHGFEVTGQIQVADSPPMWPMSRSPR